MAHSTGSLLSIEPFPHCEALDGCHCVTSSLTKMFRYSGHPLSEELLFGLGAGMGFIYWQMKIGSMATVFIGGRGNVKGFYQDLAKRTGIVIQEIQTSSAKKAERALLQSLAQKQPVMMGGDMGMLPWFELPKDYHFGGHTFVVCGFDGKDTVLASDINQTASGIKKGFFAPISLEQLSKARSSPFQPLPPKNLWLEFDFAGFHKPRANDVMAAIRQTIDAHLNPPIKNFGVSGMRHTASQILKWPDLFSEHALRMNLFNLYIFIEIGGTGGGCFRPMFARFLKESAAIAGNRALLKSAESFEKIGSSFSSIALMFKDTATMKDLRGAIQAASDGFSELAEKEEEEYRFLEKSL